MSEIHILDKGVYAVTNLYHPIASVNAGFMTTKNFVVHIDAGMTAIDGEYLLRASTEKLGKKPKEIWLVLTHNHSDHLFGMGAIKGAGAKVIAHRWVRQFLLHRTLPTFRRVIDTYKDFIVKKIAETKSQDVEQIEKTLGNVKLALPDIIFDEDFALKLDEEDEIELLYTPGHVPGEISVYHKVSKVLFAGDTIYAGMPPTTRFGGPKEWKQWIKSLQKLQELEIKKIVPGHGNVCEKDEIQRNIEYLEKML
ncbi:MAG: MBL fold metallo-hydrolase [Candidatus Bathyarchaeia archaeon]